MAATPPGSRLLLIAQFLFCRAFSRTANSSSGGCVAIGDGPSIVAALAELQPQDLHVTLLQSGLLLARADRATHPHAAQRKAALGHAAHHKQLSQQQLQLPTQLQRNVDQQAARQPLVPELAEALKPEEHEWTWQELAHTVMLWAVLVCVFHFGGRPGRPASAGSSSPQQATTDISVPTPSQPPPDLPADGAGTYHAEALAPPLPAGKTLLEVLGGKESYVANNVAISSEDGSTTWTYAKLLAGMRSHDWDALCAHACVAVSLPPGCELAVSLLNVIARTKCAPLDPALSEQEATAALRQLKVTAVLLGPYATDAPGAYKAAASLGLETFRIASFGTGRVAPTAASRPSASDVESAPETAEQTAWNTADDVALLLRTSGTTGQSKVVPLTLGQLLQGGQCIAASMKLGSRDICLNAMPLFHIGGISCNLLTTVVSGGTVLCCERRFNPVDFAGQLLSSADRQPTWYYCSPTMHMALADRFASSPDGWRTHRLRLVRSSSAVLPPPLQERLEVLLKCPVLAGYNMTECMPIASPVLDSGDVKGGALRCQPLGSVGKSIGPHLELRHGEVMLSGPLVTRGYEGPTSGWTDEGLFPTGDLGYLDADEVLWLVGRRKEVINQGGETLSPQELEEAVVEHGMVKEVVAYAVPHERLGEAVALAVQVEDASTQAGSQQLLEVAQELAERMAVGHRPCLLSFVSALPRTPTGKIRRLALHAWLREAGGPATMTGQERQLVVLDARRLPAEGATSGKSNRVEALTPEPGTVAALFREEELAAATPGNTDDELVDSLGIARKASALAEFEQMVVENMIVIGVLAVNLRHWLWYGTHILFQFKESPPLFCWILHLTENSWHLLVFVTGAGYLDAANMRGRKEPGPVFGTRDAAILMVMFTIIGWHWLVFFCIGRETPFLSGWNHPAKWFFETLFQARVFVVLASRAGVSRINQSLIVIPYAGFMPQIFGYLHPWAYHVSELRKESLCIFYYTYAFLWLPGIVKAVAKSGPSTVLGDRLRGFACWLGFSLWILVEFAEDRRQLVATRWVAGVAWVVPTPNQFVISAVTLSLLAGGQAYAPLFGIPKIVRKSLLGSLALVLVPMQAEVMDFLAKVLRNMPCGELGQIAFLVGFFGVLMGVLAPVAQFIVLGTVTSCATLLSKCASWTKSCD